MRRLLHLIVLLLLVAPDSGAQALPQPRFTSALSTLHTLDNGQGSLPGICRGSKSRAVVRGAVFGFVAVGAVSALFALARGVYRVAAFKRPSDFPVIELAAAGALIGAVLEGVGWERRCG